MISQRCMINQMRDRIPKGLLLIVTSGGLAFIILILAITGFGYTLYESVQIISPLAMVLLTLGLVYSTWKYATDIRRTTRLDRRRYHTEILRNRVESWLNNLPDVRVTEVEPPQQSEIRIAGETEFNAVPWFLDDDPYFKDLLINHADDLQEHRTQIEEGHKKFTALQEQFREEIDVDHWDERLNSIECDEVSLKIVDQFSLWIFERIIMLDREDPKKFTSGDYEKEDLYEIAKSAVNDETYGRSDFTIYPGDNIRKTPTIKLKNARSLDRETRDEIDQIVLQFLKEVIDDIEQFNVYQVGQDAADQLNSLADLVQELEIRLVEYRDLEIYEGDCKYITSPD